MLLQSKFNAKMQYTIISLYRVQYMCLLSVVMDLDEPVPINPAAGDDPGKNCSLS